MKRITATIIALVFVALSLSACSLEPYKSDYDEGYEYGYDAGLERGYAIAEDEYSGLEYEASDYASYHTGWLPEEAMWIIDAYQGNAPLYHGDVPSEEDYTAAIESLYRFYEYFYRRMYE